MKFIHLDPEPWVMGLCDTKVTLDDSFLGLAPPPPTTPYKHTDTHLHLSSLKKGTYPTWEKAEEDATCDSY